MRASPSRLAAGLLAGLLVGPWAALLVGVGACASRGDGVEERALLRRVRPPVAFAMLRDNREMMVLDMRQPEEFVGALGHLPRARSFPLGELPERLHELGGVEDSTFLIYCREGDCAERAMKIFLDAGFRNVVVMEGGIEAWLNAGFGTVGSESGGVRARGMPPKLPKRKGERGPPPLLPR